MIQNVRELDDVVRRLVAGMYFSDDDEPPYVATDLNALDRLGNGLIHAAAFGRDVEAIRVLIINGANVDLPDGDLGYTALHFAAHSGDLELINALLACGASDKRARDGLRPSDIANDREVHRRITQAGAGR